jgi:hypothetical protein
MRAVSTPKPWFAARASPEILRRTLLKAGVGVVMSEHVSRFQSYKVSMSLSGYSTLKH